MDVTIVHGPGNAAARIALNPGEECTSEAGAMIAMSGNMSITTSTHKRSSGSVLKAMRRMLAGESFFLNHYKAGANGGELLLATTLPGDMLSLDLANERLIVQSGSFVAAGTGIDLDMNWQGFKSLLSGESIFWLSVGGNGSLVLSSFGAIYPIEVEDEYIVDSGHIVAFQESLSFSITKAGKSWISSILGGEGLVCKFKGQGTVFCQSHNPQGFGHALGPLLRPRQA